MVKSKEELLAEFGNIVGERNDDDVLSFIENISDTLDDKSLSTSDNEWEEKYKKLDETWRERYKARFLSGKCEEVEEENNGESDREDLEKFDELFKESEEK